MAEMREAEEAGTFSVEDHELGYLDDDGEEAQSRTEAPSVLGPYWSQNCQQFEIKPASGIEGNDGEEDCDPSNQNLNLEAQILGDQISKILEAKMQSTEETRRKCSK